VYQSFDVGAGDKAWREKVRDGDVGLGQRLIGAEKGARQNEEECATRLKRGARADEERGHCMSDNVDISDIKPSHA
jgi:hypothetical protein